MRYIGLNATAYRTFGHSEQAFSSINDGKQIRRAWHVLAIKDLESSCSNARDGR